MNTYYNPSGAPASGSQGLSALIRGEFASIAGAFATLPPLAIGNAGKYVIYGPDGLELIAGAPVPPSGQWAPTVTNVSPSTSASAAGPWNYAQIGSIVVFSGTLVVTSPVFPGYGTVTISLPVASNFTSATDASGTAVDNAYRYSTVLTAKPSSQLLTLTTSNVNSSYGSATLTCSGTYLVH